MWLYSVYIEVTKPDFMFLYNVGVYTPYGRIVKQYYATTRTEACNQAWGDGHTVVDCDYHDHD